MSNACMTAVFRHSKSKGSARLVLLAMADEANDEGLLTAYRRSQSWLARKANVDEGTARRAIAALVESGEVLLLARGDGRASSDYRLSLPGIEGVQDAPPAPADRAPRPGEMHPQGAQPAPPIIPLLPVGSLSAPEDDGFEAFWAAYPRKTDKANARKAWPRALRKTTADVLLAGARRLAAERRDPKFTPHASTWLNGERWTDAPITTNRPAHADYLDSDERRAEPDRRISADEIWGTA